MKRPTSLLLVGVCVWTGALNSTALSADSAIFVLPKPTLSGKAAVVETSDDKRIRVELRQIRGRYYETLVVNAGRHIYRVPDERVFTAFDEDAPDNRYDHEFSLSPKADYLFVTRKLFHPVNVGYLYRLSGSRPGLVRPLGKRFDEAAIRFFARRLHFPYPTIGAGTRVIKFDHWTRDRLVFSLGLNRRYDRSGHEYSIVGDYGLKSGRFGLISEAVDVD